MTLVGDATKANATSTTPPETMDFYLISSTLRLSFWSGLAFGFAVGVIFFSLFFKTIFLVSITIEFKIARYCYCQLIYYVFLVSCNADERVRHYFMFGPFGLLMFIYDFVLWLCQNSCCKRRKALYTPRLGEREEAGQLQIIPEAFEQEDGHNENVNLI